MRPASSTLHSLRQSIALIGRDGARHENGRSQERVQTGYEAVDQALGGGLMRGALHEILPQKPNDLAAATGFCLGLVARSTGARDWIWIREDQTLREAGQPYGPGLVGFGLDPARLLLVATRNTQDALKAAEDALHCHALGAVLFEPWGDPKSLDLTTTRRLTLASEDSSVPLIILRSGGRSASGTARTRWIVTSKMSASVEEPGIPRWSIDLVLNRQSGARGGVRTWVMEWRYDECLFRPTDSVGHLSASINGPTETSHATQLRRSI